jgi:TonB family protein
MSIWFKTLTVFLALCFGLAVPPPQNSGNRRVIEMKAPAYPRIAQTIHAIGTVKIEVEIDKEGSVVSAHAISGHPLLQAVSVQAARNWKFEPDQQNSKVILLFDFFDGDSAEALSAGDRCRDSFSVVDPYHIKVFGYTKVEASSDVEDYVPKDLEGTLCKVHRQVLRRDRVDIAYGLMGFKPGYEKAEKKFFPNANSKVYGGCVLSTTRDPCTGQEVQLSPKYAEVLFCPACRRAKERWSKSHPWRDANSK